MYLSISVLLFPCHDEEAGLFPQFLPGKQSTDVSVLGFQQLLVSSIYHPPELPPHAP